MVYRMATLVLAVLALTLFVGAPALAQDKNTHEGTFVSAKGNQFTMEAKGKEHTHTLALGAKVLKEDGKECKLEELRKGQKIRVTTKDGDNKIATKVEVMKDKK